MDTVFYLELEAKRRIKEACEYGEEAQGSRSIKELKKADSAVQSNHTSLTPPTLETLLRYLGLRKVGAEGVH